MDDSVETARILAGLLTRLGHYVDLVHSGEAALSFVLGRGELPLSYTPAARAR